MNSYRITVLFSLSAALLACSGWSTTSTGNRFEHLLDENMVETPIGQTDDAPKPPPPPADVQLDPTDLVVVKGRPDRPTIVQYSDWKCPHCTAALPKVAEASEDTGATLVFRHYVLDGTCNPNVDRKSDPARCELAKAAICRHNEGAFWDFAETFKSHGDDVLTRLKGRDALDACMTSDQTTAALTTQVASGNDLNIRGTPMFYWIDGDDRFALDSVDEVLSRLRRP